jgi:putative ABC transport system permease protein
MRALRFALLALSRDWRSGELAVLLLALLVAVTALTGVGFFTDRIGQAVEQRAAEVLAADLRLRSPEPISADYESLAAKQDIADRAHGDVPERRLLRHRLGTRGGPRHGSGLPAPRPSQDFGRSLHAGARDRLAPGPWRGLARAATARAARRACRRPRERRRRELYGFSACWTTGPTRAPLSSDLAPSILLPLADLDATGLLAPGSRATYALLFAGKPADIRAFRPVLEERKTKSERLVGIAEESPQVQSSSRRAGRFLNLSAMITVLLAAVAVAMAARRYTRRHLDNVALMKCMGAPQRLVLQVTVIELAFVALIAALVGSLLGYGAQEFLTRVLGDLVQADLPPPTLAPAVLGGATALAILVGFALPPMLQLKRVPPARVLRRNLEPPPLRYSVSYGLAVAR